MRRKLPEVLEEANELTPLGHTLFKHLYEDFKGIDEKVKSLDKWIHVLCQQSEDCQRLTTIEGIGPLTATALVSAIGNINSFKNGRHLAAWLGLVPREHSSGNKRLLLGISKRGDRYLRTLLIHGARSVISLSKRRSEGLDKLIQRCGKPKAYVALANKNARIVGALLAKKVTYQTAYGM